MDQVRAFRDVAAERLQDPPPTGLAVAAADQDEAVRGDRGGDADAVAGDPAEFPPVDHRQPGRRLLEVGLVNVDVAVEDDAVLDALERREELDRPVAAGGNRVHVGQPGLPDAFVLGDVDEVFHPFRRRYFVGVEKGSRQRPEGAAAGLAAVPCYAFFVPSPADRAREPAARAGSGRNRVQHRDFLRRGLRVLLERPVGDGRLDHRGEFVAVLGRRKHGLDGLWSLFHGGFLIIGVPRGNRQVSSAGHPDDN